jgi:hypothetical protein
MSAERVYRLLLRAYPPEFRAEYGREMVLLFRDQCRDSHVRTVGFWAAVIWDVARSAPALRVEAWRERARESTRTMEVVMKIAAMLAMLLGGLGILNAAIEWSAGGNGTTEHVISLVLGVGAAALLLAAGVPLLRSTERGRQTARLTLVASLVLIVAARLLHPWMSILSQLVGIALPAAFLIALYWPRRAPLES